MNIWPADPVSIEPEVILANWRVMEVDAGTHHFVGRNVHEQSGRVSSAIVRFDYRTMIAETRSGRIYRLQGEPGYDEDGQYVWSWWHLAHCKSDGKDVTGEYWLAGAA